MVTACSIHTCVANKCMAIEKIASYVGSPGNIAVATTQLITILCSTI